MSFPILKAAFAVIAGASAAGFMLAPARAAGPPAGAAPLTLKSTSVELPDSDRAFPPGPGVDTVSANCAACHSPGMILYQPNLPKAAWEGEVNKMIKIYKAPVAAADVPAIVAYLAATKGS